ARQITQQVLETYGYRVLTAADGAEAVALYAARQHEIAVVLTDMMMPVMDGAATIQELRRINPQARIIAASGIHAESTVSKAVSTGADYFIPKPCKTEVLLKVLHEVVSRPVLPDSRSLSSGA
ncbi:MAG: response regulator, partial [Prosthecobacter sp.]|nr:response regulator [Prosthecobacter sp.]